MKVPRNYGWIAVGAVLFLVLFANSGFRTMVRRYWELYRLNREFAQLKRENVLLNREIYYLERSPSYIEHIARRELGLVSPGEVEYRFRKK